jgi:enoyl-CoA hydratase
MEAYLANFLDGWTKLSDTRKPVIAAVSGFCLGGGLELAMMCDIIIASETARFALPEITLGIMPGAGGTQRLPRFIGKAKAMDLILTGRMMDAHEAERSGLVARVTAADKLMDEALAAAARIASYSRPIVMMAKETVNRAQEVPLSEGVRFERRLFLSMFATEDQKEGMNAFIAKRKPEFRNR